MPTNGYQPDNGQREALSSQTSSTSRRHLLHLLGTSSIAGIAGCSAGGEEGTKTGTEPGPDTATATDTGKELQQSAAIGLPRSVTGGWTAFYGGMSGYFTRVLEPLVWTTPELKAKPWLATDWKPTGETTWKFDLREGVTFHNGKPLNAEAVDFSFKVLLDQGWTEGWLPIKDVSPLDDMAVEFTTTKPVGNLPAQLAHNLAAIQHPERTKGAGSKGHPIGTGPYKVEEIKQSQHIRVSSFNDYWNGSPKMEKLTFREVGDANTRALQLTGHEIDVGLDLPPSQIETIKNNKATNTTVEYKPDFSLFFFNTVRGVTTDIKFRKALNYAVSQKQIVKAALNGIGKPARGHIPPQVWWSAHDSLPKYGQDKTKAKQLVKQSKYDGETIRILANPGSSFFQSPKLAAEVVRQSFTDIDVDAEIQMTKTVNEDKAQKGDHLYLISGGTVSAAADYLLMVYHTDNDTIAKWLEDPLPTDKVDSLLNKGQQTHDDEVKKDAYQEVQQIVVDHALFLPVAHSGYVAGTYKDIGKFNFPTMYEFSRWENLEHYE